MAQTTTASATFSNRHAAQRAAHRLVDGGFSRESIEMRRLHSDDETIEVSVRVKEGNVARAEDLLHARPDVHGFAGDRVDVGPLMMLAGAIAAGAAGYTLYTLNRNRRQEASREDQDERPAPTRRRSTKSPATRSAAKAPKGRPRSATKG
jgi:hypothetical protein